MKSTVTSIPQPRPRPLLGNIPDLDAETPVQSLVELGRRHGPIFRLSLPGQQLVAVSSHALVDELCDESRFGKCVHTALREVRDFAGDGLFTAETEQPNWGRAHRILTPAFGPLAMRGYFDAMLDVAEQLVTKWERLGPGAELDVPDSMTRLTLDTIALCGFGYRFNSFYQREMHPFIDAMVSCLTEAGARTRRMPLQTKLMLGTRRAYEADKAAMFAVVDRLIAERRRSGEKQAAGEDAGSEGGGEARKDLLALMLAGRDPQTGEGLDDLNIRYQIITFLIAGHETTSGLLSFALYELLNNPEVLQRATDEVDRVLGPDRNAPPRFDQLRHLVYLDQVVRETLRLHPTAPAFALSAREDTLLGGTYPVSKSDALLVLTPLLHLDPAVWGPDPERFDPDRFAPEKLPSIPRNAWKPFGSGQRACIGRQFATQEALLVLALILRRFSLSPRPEYQLRIKETLTLKPDGFTVHARARTDRAAAAASKTEAPLPAPIETSPVAAHGTPLLVLYGSDGGSTEAFARRLAAGGADHGYAAEVAPLDEHAGKLPVGGAVAIVTASYNGQPPANARRFCSWLEAVRPGTLAGVRYVVFGCGHRDWAATFQAVPRKIDTLLADAGAERLVPRGEADGGGDFFGAFDDWYGRLWGTLRERFGLDARADADDDAAGAPSLEIQRLPGARESVQARHGLTPFQVLENRELVAPGAPDARSKRHVVFQLPSGVSYRAGDHLAVLPQNPADQVDRALRRFALSGDDELLLRHTRAGSSPLPVGRPISARALLRDHVELATTATRRDLELLAAHTACPPEKRSLLARLETYESAIVDKRVSLLDLLDEVASCALPLEAFLERLPALKPRRYSISSSPAVDPGRCSITVAVVDAPAWCGQGRFLGSCSNFLRGVEAGSTVPAAIVDHPGFRLPDDPRTPLVLVAAGTGIAPLRGFLEERAALAAAGRALGPADLFFGCTDPDVDFLYRDELAAWEARGIVTVHLAFSRRPTDGIRYVQDRLWAERALVTQRLAEGGYFYVCGEGRRMAPAVRETLGRIVGPALARLDAEGRYLADVFA